MNGRDLLEGMGFVDDRFVEEAETARMGKPMHHWARRASMAACVCIVATTLWFWMGYSSGDDQSAAEDSAALQHSTTASTQTAISTEAEKESTDAMSHEEEAKLFGVTIPQMELNLDTGRGLSADMVSFFIYQGRSYVQYEWLKDSQNLVGEYLGTATGMINEWTPQEGYVELAGSVSGDFYAVEGMSPDFMLCMEQDNDDILTFINNNGLTLALGAELYEERLHLSGNYSAVEFRAHGQKTAVSLDDVCYEVVERLLSALNQGEFLYSEDVPLADPETHPSETVVGTCLYHLIFRMDNGMSWQLRLYQGGYVRLYGLSSVCVQVSTEVFEELTDMLEKKG